MYTIKIDDTLVYDPRLPDYRIQEAVLKQQINKAGSFTVTLPPKHPKRTLAQRLKSTILVRQDNVTIFRGRILNEKSDFYGSRQLTCEGQLAFFNDSIVRPYEYSGSVEGYLQRLIDSHNSQVPADRQFSLGNVTVTDPNDSIVRASEQYPTTWDEINDKLLDLLGGYLIPRVEGNTVYIDYLSDISTKNLQDVEFGKNLLDLSQIIKGQDIATVIIPLGSRQEDGSRVTIASVNDGKDYVENTEAISMYGRITKTVCHDDVTSPSNLLRKGNEDLQQSALQTETINVTAADLSFAGYDIQSFRFARYVGVISKPHGLSTYMLVSQCESDLLHPEKGKLTLGKTKKTFTGIQLELQQEQKRENINIFEKIEDIQENIEIAYTEISNSYTNATKTANEIMMEAVKEYVKTSDLETFKQQMSTQFVQSAESVDIIFERLTEQIRTLEGDTTSEFAAWKKYIRFVDGSIVLGQEENPLILTLVNDEIRFTNNGVKVAWFSHNQMHINSLEILNTATICGLVISWDGEMIAID